MKKILTILLLLVSLVSFSQEYQTSIKLDSLIWIKINEYRTSDSAIIYGMVPNVITVFALGEWREFAYDATVKHSNLYSEDFSVDWHTDPKKLASRNITGECLHQMWVRIKDDDDYGDTDLSDEVTLDRIATSVVVGWINSPTHRIVLNWIADVESCVTSVITKVPVDPALGTDIGDEDYFYRINITYQTKEDREYNYSAK